jgi:drug/metabolite transporter (DMT)-like permease
VPPNAAARPVPSRSVADHRRGVALLALSALIFTVEVALVRFVGARATPEQVVFCRAFAQFALVLAWFVWTGRWSSLQTNRPDLHLARGFASITSWWFYYKSFLSLDLALATTLTFTSQLFVVAFAAPILGEQVGLRRAGLAALGFAGVVVVTRIGTVQFDPTVLYGLFSAVVGAGIIFLSRALTRTETTPAILFYIGVMTTLASGAALLARPAPIEPSDLALIALAGALGAIGMGVMIEAYRVGEVSALAPVPYLRLVLALVIGLLVFGEIPTWTTLLGAAIIVAAALGASRSG